MNTFRDIDGNWREHIQRVEGDMPKVAVSYTLQEGVTERGKVKLRGSRNGSKGLWRDTE
jgi:hypothetical protein